MKKRILSLTVILSLILTLFSAISLPASATSINIGDYVEMGTYYGQPILWRCVDIDENGPLMLSDKILCLKAFDAFGTNTSGSHGRGYYYNNTQGYYRQIWGSDYWADSNMRCWLNSTASSGNVVWSCGNPPDEAHVWGGYNEYDGEAGFLSNFTQNERNAMKTVTQKSLLNGYEYSQGSSNTKNSNYHRYNGSISDIVQNYDTAYSEQVTDTMFLLDVKQINRVYQNDSQLGGNDYYIGYPTPECVSNSEYQTSSLSSTSSWYSWLRSPGDDNYGDCVRIVDSGGYVSYGSACDGDVGVRPAFYLNSQSAAFTGGDGSVSSPYSFAATSVTLLKIGDYVEMGTYYGQPILWRCVDIDGNGPLMLSDRILCLKPFDASGTNTSGSHGRGYYYNNTQGECRQGFGSDYWADSNIRCWLNSTASAGNVVWSCGNPPDEAHVQAGYNEYDGEAGFLSNFTQKERNAMKTVTQKSLLDGYEYSSGSSNTLNSNYHRYSDYISDVVQNYDTAYSEQVTDTMFLLDVKQIYRVFVNDGPLGGNNYYIGYPTPECVSNSEFRNFMLSSSVRWYSWLRSPNANYSGDTARFVNIHGYVDDLLAYTSNYGVRPAFYLDLVTFTGGNGSKESPYSNTQKYTYNFVDENGTVLKEETATEGMVITPPATNPTKPSTAQYTYTFAGWSGYTQNMTLTQNVTFTATYTSTVNQYTYQFKDTDGSVLKEQTADYGTVITPPATPAVNDPYTFDHWQDFTEGMTLTENKTFTALYKYKTYQITAEGLPSPVTVNYHEDFTIDPQTRNGYSFPGYYTQPNGLGTKITDENGNSITVYNIEGDLTVYPYFVSEYINKIVITGDPTGEAGSLISQRPIFATDKQAKYFVCSVRYSKDLELTQITGIDFNVSEDLRETAGEYTRSYFTCEYRGVGNMPTNENLIPFELVFNIPEDAGVNDSFTLEIMEDAILVGNNTYGFESFENSTVTVTGCSNNGINIIGANIIDSPEAYTALTDSENASQPEVEWSVDDETVAEVSQNGILTPLKKGKVTLRATAKDGSGLYGEKVITVKKYAEISGFSSNSGVWSKAFSPSVYEYEIYVPESSTSIRLTASHGGTLKSADGSKIFINNVAKPISLSGDQTLLELKYTEEGFDDNTYRITIVKYKGTKTSVSADGRTFTVNPVSITNGSLVILALYNENVLADSKFAIYTGTPLTFTTDKTYTNAKVMIWNSFTALTPLCSAELLMKPLN